MNLKTACALLGLILLAGCNNNDTRDRSDRTSSSDRDPRNDRSTTGGSRQVLQADRDWVLESASGGLFEVESSKLALQKGVDESEREFAQMMIDDHSKANNELKAIASRKGLSTPPALNPKHQQLMDELRGLNARPFQDRYHQIQVTEHEEAIRHFERGANTLKDQDLRSFAERTLPTLRKHLNHAKGHQH